MNNSTIHDQTRGQMAPGGWSPNLFEMASRYVAAGISVIPIAADGTKRPAGWLLRDWREPEQQFRSSWTPYQQSLPPKAEVERWFGPLCWPCGIGVVCGQVSGNLECIDLDTFDLVEPWFEQVERQQAGLIDRLVLVQTPRPGLHVYYRAPAIEGSQRLAIAQQTDPELGRQVIKTLIETRGEGAYVVAPPSPASCHPSGRPYRYVFERDLADVQTIGSAERDILLGAARNLTQYVEPSRPSAQPRNITAGEQRRPGDDFNLRARWADILGPRGWTLVSAAPDGAENWRRPGKTTGVSATANFAGTNLLHVFSSNAHPLESGRTYNKFVAFTLLNHKGDFQAAAKAVAKAGYGASHRHANFAAMFSANRQRR